MRAAARGSTRSSSRCRAGQPWTRASASIWARSELHQARALAVTATQQLAKRQRTWLRAESDLHALDPASDAQFANLVATLRREC